MTESGTQNNKGLRRAILFGAIGAVILVIVVGTVAIFRNLGPAGTGNDAAPTRAPATEAPEGPSPTPAAPEQCGQGAVTVSNAKQLDAALADAEPGSVIQLAEGIYEGEFVATAQGTAERPITLCGPAGAILDGGGIEEHYVLHLDGVSHWIVSGFSVRNGQKGVMADRATHTLIQGLTVSNIGDEGIHLRTFSSDNTVAGNTVSATGLRKPKAGEGIYVGSAESNWCEYTDCQPDTSNRNLIVGNTIFGTTAESIDLKEGSSDGIVRNNTFDGSTITAADSWVDVKGNNWLIEGNTGTNSPGDGFQVHEILDGWGSGNVFHANTANVNGPGFGYALTPELDNVVQCTNKTSNAGEGTTNVTCSRS